MADEAQVVYRLEVRVRDTTGFNVEQILRARTLDVVGDFESKRYRYEVTLTERGEGRFADRTLFAADGS